MLVQPTCTPVRPASGLSSDVPPARQLPPVLAQPRQALTHGEVPDGPATHRVSALLALSPVVDPPSLIPAPVIAPAPLAGSLLPRCLACGHRTAEPHPRCRPLVGYVWTPCYDCQGLRMIAGRECQLCCGVGFFDESARDTLAERAGEPAEPDETTWLVTSPALAMVA